MAGSGRGATADPPRTPTRDGRRSLPEREDSQSAAQVPPQHLSPPSSPHRECGRLDSRCWPQRENPSLPRLMVAIAKPRESPHLPRHHSSESFGEPMTAGGRGCRSSALARQADSHCEAGRYRRHLALRLTVRPARTRSRERTCSVDSFEVVQPARKVDLVDLVGLVLCSRDRMSRLQYVGNTVARFVRDESIPNQRLDRRTEVLLLDAVLIEPGVRVRFHLQAFMPQRQRGDLLLEIAPRAEAALRICHGVPL